MTESDAGNRARQLLRRLAAADERSLQSALRLVLAPDDDDATTMVSLDRQTMLLVRLGALLALDAPTDSLRWASELAASVGAGEDALAGVLIATGSAAGSAQLVASASRLAAALDFDTETPDAACDY